MKENTIASEHHFDRQDLSDKLVVLVQFKSKQELIDRLGDLVGEWSNLGKDVDDLWQEYLQREIEFVEINGELVRLLKVANVYVYYTDETGQKWQLVEEKQVFKQKLDQHGNPLQRVRKNIRCVGGKVKVGEEVTSTALAELKEELFDRNPEFEDRPINIDASRLEGGQLTLGEAIDSFSYPGLKSRYDVYEFSIDLQQDEYQPRYVEEQVKKTSYYVWERLDDQGLS